MKVFGLLHLEMGHPMGQAAFELTMWVSWFVSCCCNKDHDQQQLGKGAVYLPASAPS